MNFIYAIILGIVQGITEFLPVSSSGHLVIFQNLIKGFSQPGVLFDVILHFATMMAVIVYFRKEIVRFYINNLFNVIIASIPAALLGYFFQDFFEGLFVNLFAVGLALIITSAMNFLTGLSKSQKQHINKKDSLLIGIAQAIAITPGISRSGATIFAGSSLGIDRKETAKFSFLISVPAILGANILQIVKYRQTIALDHYWNYIAGFIIALIFGYLSIHFVFKLLSGNKYRYFAYYTFILGLLLILI